MHNCNKASDEALEEGIHGEYSSLLIGITRAVLDISLTGTVGQFVIRCFGLNRLSDIKREEIKAFLVPA